MHSDGEPRNQRKKPSGSAADPASEPASIPAQEEYVLTDLEQIRVLADPLRVRLLESFCRARTTKQVAELLGEKSTKLYHHVDALERVGLIELAHTRPNRGTLEKYYLAVARTFRADSSIFSGVDAEPDGEDAASLAQMVSTIFDTTSAELRQLVQSGEAGEGLEQEGVLSFIEIQATEETLHTIRDRLQGVLDFVTSLGTDDDSEDLLRYRLTVAYFPRERPPWVED